MAKAPAKKAPAKAKAVGRKSVPLAKPASATGKARASNLQKVQIAPSAPKPRSDRRGTPKGKGVVAQNGGRIGNPPFEPTAEQAKIVETHAAVGTPQWLVAEELGVSEDTLQRHFRKELDRGLLRINARIGAQIAKQALAGCRTSQIFWMKTRGGYKSAATLELGGIGGAPIQHAVSADVDFSRLSREEKRALEALMIKAEAAGDDAKA